MTPRQCPWCRKLPSIQTKVPSGRKTVKCETLACPVKPETAEPKDTEAEAVGLWNIWGDDRPARAPKAPKKSRKKAAAVLEMPSFEGQRFAEWFRTLLPADIVMPNLYEYHWGRAYDLLIAEGRPDADIRAVCGWARADRGDGRWMGWSNTFFSPTQLTQANRQGIAYFDVFKAQMQSGSKPAQHQQGPALQSRKYYEA